MSNISGSPGQTMSSSVTMVLLLDKDKYEFAGKTKEKKVPAFNVGDP